MPRLYSTIFRNLLAVVAAVPADQQVVVAPRLRFDSVIQRVLAKLAGIPPELRGFHAGNRVLQALQDRHGWRRIIPRL
jgi:hypothetical protein